MDIIEQNQTVIPNAIVPTPVPVQEPTQFKIPEPPMIVPTSSGGRGSQLPLLSIILLLIITVFGAGIYLGRTYFSSPNLFSKPTPTPTVAVASPSATPTTDPTANWKTYKNEKYGFEFKYPNSWFQNTITQPNLFSFADNDEVGLSQLEGVIFNITIFSKDEKNFEATKKMMDDLINNQESQVVKGKITKVGIITIDGNEIVKYSYDQNPSAQFADINIKGAYAMVGNYFYQLELKSSNEKNISQLFFDQILSTFKFTGKGATGSLTANWRTYTSPKFTFSIKYPNSINDPKFAGEWTFGEISGSSTLGGGVGFGPSASKSGGWVWGVYVYGGVEEEKLIAEMGNQFSDRKEEKKEITVNGLPAMMVTVTTPQIKDWIYKAVFIQAKTPGQSTIYKIDNGAVDLPEFDSFVESFRLTH